MPRNLDKPRRSMRYTDQMGRKRTLTWEQWVYLGAARVRGFERSWGGLSSTQTVRILSERGLIRLDDMWYPHRPWRVYGLTKLGEQVLARWNDEEN